MTRSTKRNTIDNSLSPNIIRWIKTGVWTLWVLLILLIISSAAGENPVKPSSSIHLLQLTVIPEGWAFFTRDPKEAVKIVYKKDDKKLTKLTFSNTSRKSFYGFSRAARVFNAELARLLIPVLDSSWHLCNGSPFDCIAQFEGEFLELINWSGTRYICGKIVVVKRPPIPWAWSSSDTIYMDSKILSIKVDCSQQYNKVYK